MGNLTKTICDPKVEKHWYRMIHLCCNPNIKNLVISNHDKVFDVRVTMVGGNYKEYITSIVTKTEHKWLSVCV